MHRVNHHTHWFAASLLLTLLSGGPVLAEDTELYIGTSAELGPDYYPNVLFVLDTSGSMENDSGNGNTRMEVLQQVVSNLLDGLENVKVGVMRFDTGYSIGGVFSLENFVEGGGMVIHAMEEIENSRESVRSTVNNMKASGTTQLSETMYEAGLYYMGKGVDFGLESYVGNYWDDKDDNELTPSVAESRDGDTYVSPIGQCSKNHIVLLTDGFAQLDTGANDKVPLWPGFPDEACTDNPDWNQSGLNVDGDGDCLDDVAAYLFDNDLYGDASDGVQNVVTHTIGFFTDSPLLEETAERGGGRYYVADDADSLTSALQNIFAEVREEGGTFTSPAVSINAFDRSSHLDQLYFSLFKPSLSAHWDGNLKRYRLGSGDEDMVVFDQDSVLAVDDNTGFFREDTRSWWTDSFDGHDVAVGGVASLLDTNRQILTQSDLGVMISVDESNKALFESDPFFGLDSLPDATLKNLLKWASGIDVLDDDEDGSTNDARQILGDPMHSKPVIVNYDKGVEEDNDPNLVVFLGTNDGYLHAISGRTGEELFAFVPAELMPNLIPLYEGNLDAENKIYGVDGPITAWVDDGGDGVVEAANGDHVYLYFGLRRGGDRTYALDVTNPNSPTFMWSISSSTPGYGDMGQSWSKPVVTKVKTGSYEFGEVKDVVVFGGGYDTRQDEYSDFGPDSSGNAIYMADAHTGALVWSATSAGFPEMTNAIPSTVRVIDLDLDGLADRMYAGDMGGRVWRFDIHNPVAEGMNFEVTGGAIARLGGTESAAPADNRRFYYAPDVALGTSDGDDFMNITIGSGYRAHPKDEITDDWFYAIRDFHPFARLGVGEGSENHYTDGYGVTHDSLPTITTADYSIPENAPGFKFQLNAAGGEKVLSESRIFQNEAYFTSFAPETNAFNGNCFAHLGVGRLYAINLGTGGISETELDRPGIPPEPIFIFDEDDDEGGDTGRVCFSDYCDDPPPEEPPPCEGEECPAEEEDDDGRDVGCLVGPEDCDAGANEVPVRTFWTDLNTDR